MSVLIAGSSELIGTALRERLSVDGISVRRLVRHQSHQPGDVFWQPGTPLNPAVLDDTEAIINLAGASIGKLPWTRSRRRAILQSRLDATNTLVSALHANPGPVLINASAVGVYGSRADEELVESSSAGAGFLADVTQQWETAARAAESVSRVVLLRTGLVVANSGAMAPLKALTMLGAGGPLGSGRQWWPWISLRDEVAAIVHVLQSDLAGPVNLAGPTPATMAEVGRALARQLRRPLWLPAPAFALRSLLGQAADELLLSSQRVIPNRLLETGFAFQDRTVESALAQMAEPATGTPRHPGA